MHLRLAKLIGCLLCLCLAVVSVYAQAGWWDKLLGGGSDKENTSEPSSAPLSASSLTSKDLTQAFTQALRLGSERVVSQVGKPGGFNDDQRIRIPLPDQLVTMKTWLDKVGMGATLDDLEIRLNRAAELAAPEAKALFIQTIEQMRFEDIQSIYQGGNDAATRYFQSKMTPQLTQAMTPIVERSLSEAGAVKLYDQAVANYQSIPFVPDLKANLVSHVVEGGLGGIFHYLAKEEAAIRENPVRRTTELLQRVFGAK